MAAPKCTYCPNFATTKDHIPPKNLFSKPRPINLITVPSCKKCNKSFEMDDEWFRLVLSMEVSTQGNNAAESARAKSWSGLSKPEARKFKQAFLTDIEPREMMSAAGLYLGSTLTYTVDQDRLINTLMRIVRGLYFRDTRSRLPIDCSITVGTKHKMECLPPESQEWFKTRITHPLTQVIPTEIGMGTFSYRTIHSQRFEYYSAWGLTFFESLHFFAITFPGSDSGPQLVTAANESNDE